MDRRSLLLGLPALLLPGCMGGVQWAGRSEKSAINPGNMVRASGPPLQFTTYRVPSREMFADIIRGPDGNLWFRIGKNSIGRVTVQGAVQLFPRSTGVTINELIVGPDGFLWYADWEGDLVGRLSTDGQYSAPEYKLRNNSRPTNLVATPGGAVWAGSVRNGRIWEMTPGSPGIRAIGELRSSSDLAIGPDGNVWALGSSRLFAINPRGEIVHDVELPSDGVNSDLLLTSSGEMWFIETPIREGQSLLYRWRMDEDFTPFAIGEGPIGGIVADPEGSIWLTTREAIHRLSRSGELTTFAKPANDTSLTGIAIGGDGNLWMTAPFDQAVIRAVLR